MKALRRYKRAPRAARILDVPVPEPGEGEVLLKVDYCGVCGSDLHAYLNQPGYEFVLPVVTFGHEFSGTVVKRGTNVNGWRPGEKATAVVVQGCYRDDCFHCSRGAPQLCPRRTTLGLLFDGAMAEYVVIKQQHLLPLPAEIDMCTAALTEPLSGADHCVGDRSDIGPGDLVVVTGPGIIGMLCALVARERGARVVISGTEADDAIRLPVARKIGLETILVGPNHPELAERVRGYFGREADALVEASGATGALETAHDAVRADGTITVVALYADDVTINFSRVVRKQIDVRTSYASAPANFQSALKMLAAGAIPVDELVHLYDLEDGITAMADAERQAVMKPMLVCT